MVASVCKIPNDSEPQLLTQEKARSRRAKLETSEGCRLLKVGSFMMAGKGRPVTELLHTRRAFTGPETLRSHRR